MKPHHITERKKARTAIYRAVYGDQTWSLDSKTKRSNLPWSDPSRHRPQGWSPQDAIGTLKAYREAANLDHFAASMVAHELGLDIHEVLA